MKNIKKELFLKHTYEARVLVTDEMLMDTNVDLISMVAHKMAMDFANKIVNDLVIYRHHDPEECITTFRARPVLMDSVEFNKLIDEYVLRVVDEFGAKNQEDKDGRDTEPIGPFTYPRIESNSNKD